MQEHSTEQACSTQKTPRATAHKRNKGKQGKNQQRKRGRGSLFGCSRSAAARARAGKPTQRLEPSTKDADQLADVGQRRLEAVRKGRFSASRMSGLYPRPFSAPPAWSALIVTACAARFILRAMGGQTVRECACAGVRQCCRRRAGASGAGRAHLEVDARADDLHVSRREGPVRGRTQASDRRYRRPPAEHRAARGHTRKGHRANGPLTRSVFI